MSELYAILLGMYKDWNKFTHVCQDCDALIEYTSRRRVTDITCECGGFVCWVSEEPATIQPTNERNEMEIVSQDSYNPHAFITVREIQQESNDSIYKLYKATELEGLLFENPTITALEHMPDGTLKEHTLNRADISEMFRKAQYREDWLERAQGTIRKIIDNLTVEGWYNPNTDKDEVLRDLCEILDHTPQQEMSWSVTLTVSGTSMVNLDEVEDFDIRYHLADNLSVDTNDFDTNVDSWDVDCVDSQDWN